MVAKKKTFIVDVAILVKTRSKIIIHPTRLFLFHSSKKRLQNEEACLQSYSIQNDMIKENAVQRMLWLLMASRLG